MATTLQVQLLGEFRIVRGETELTTRFSSPRLQSLLAYLLLRRGTPQSRRHLAFILWPDSSESQARTNLRKLVHVLRRALPDAVDFMQSDSQALVWLASAPCTLDVALFEQAATTAGTRGELAQAVALYQGDLLPNCYDDWIQADRERLRTEYRSALEHLVALLEEERDYASALPHAQRLLRQDPLMEEGYRRLMRLYALTGDRAGVVRIYRTCATVLERELRLEPSLETRRAYDECLARSDVPDEVAADATEAPLDAQVGHLPVPLTSFIGREREKAQVEELLSHHRLVTLTGSAGVGKTRLALAIASEIADKFNDGVYWLDLASLADPALLLQELAAVLGVRETPGLPLLQQLVSRMHAQQALLVIDNCEHLVEEVGRVAEALLHAAPHLHILVTSRESLRIAGEQTWRVPSLPVPAVPSSEGNEAKNRVMALDGSESVRLFLDRAAAALPAFVLTQENATAVGSICRQLDGIPLAIELAAARVKVLDVGQISERLDDCFRLLTGGSRTALPRQQTLRGTMDWSYRLLSAEEQVLLQRLSVFAGGFTLQAAESVAGHDGIPSSQVLDLLSSLVDKSLVEVKVRHGQTRHRLLETVRQYAHEKLVQSGQPELAQGYHLNYFTHLAEQASQGWFGFDQPAQLMHLQAEHDNLRAALEWSTGSATTAQLGLRLVGAVASFLEVQGHFAEALGWIDRLLERAGDAAPPAWRALACERAAMARVNLADFEAARSLALQAMTLYRRLGDSEHLAESLYLLGVSVSAQAQFAEARPLLEEGLAICRARGDAAGTASCLCELGLTEYALGEHSLAHTYMEQGLELCREAKSGLVYGRLAWLLGDMFRHEGNRIQARALYQEALAGAQAGIAWASPYYIEAFGYLAIEERLVLRAARLFGAGERLFEAAGAVRVPVMQSEYDQAMLELRKVLDEQALAAAWAEGRAMTMQQAVEYALDGTLSATL